MGQFQELKERVFEANISLKQRGLILQTWGNVSEFDRTNNVIAIKPSGVSYDDMTPKHIVVISPDGTVIEGTLKPSSDTPTHLAIYKHFSQACGVVHTHSTFATIFAQALLPVPCYGTTHADNFYGEVPITDQLTRQEIAGKYEHETGMVIVRTFERLAISPQQMHAVLVASHGPFTWGASGMDAVDNAEVLEEIAKTACYSKMLTPGLAPISQALLDKHYLRKHGTNAYYGQ